MVSQDVCAQLLVSKLCKPSAIFIDVGAHIGSVFAEVRHHQPSSQIIAVEAVPEKAADLARRFQEVTVHGCALGDVEGETKFFVDTRRPGYSSLAPRTRSQGVVEISVPIRRLDDLVPDSPEVDFIKIDVEGAELGVLRGAEDVIPRDRPTILFESGNSAELLGYSLQDLFDWFADRDYEIHVPNRVAHDGPGLRFEGFVESHFYPRRTLNYFAIPEERRIEIRDRARKILGVTPT